LLAFAAGLLSFASPCVLPLVPAYLGYLSGTTLHASSRPKHQGLRWALFFHAVAFVIGFSAIFVTLGASAGLVGYWLYDYLPTLWRLGGALILVFGLRVAEVRLSLWKGLGLALAAGVATALLLAGLPMGRLSFEPLSKLLDGVVISLIVLASLTGSRTARTLLAIGVAGCNLLSRLNNPVGLGTGYVVVESLLLSGLVVFVNQTDLFYRSQRLEARLSYGPGYFRSAIMGLIFAAGWTPCVGPILSAILLLASRSQTAGWGVLLLSVYSLGLGAPFLAAGAFFDVLSEWLRRINRRLRVVSLLSGLFLGLIGLAIFTDSLSSLSRFGPFIDLGL